MFSVTEGEDKPLKYPDMFAAASLMLINKIDLLPHLDFDVGACIDYARRVNPRIEVLTVSATTGEGMPAFYAWIAKRAAASAADRRRVRDTMIVAQPSLPTSQRLRPRPRARNGAGRRLPAVCLWPGATLRTRRLCANDAEGVLIEIEGARVPEFVRALRREAPPLARIDAVETRAAAPVGETHFRDRGERQGRVTHADRGRCGDLRALPRRSVRPAEPLPPLSVCQLHPLRPALHADAPAAL